MCCRRDYGPKKLPESTVAPDAELVRSLQANEATWGAGSTYAHGCSGAAQGVGPAYAMQQPRTVDAGATCSGSAGLQGLVTQYCADYVPKVTLVRLCCKRKQHMCSVGLACIAFAALSASQIKVALQDVCASMPSSFE